MGRARPRRSVRLALAAIAALALLMSAALSPARAPAAAAQAAGACPVAVSDVAATGGIAVCVDRGAGAAGAAGETATICVTANIPQILIFPPPPPPVIRLTSLVDGAAPAVIFEDAFASGQRCIEHTVQPPSGPETITIRADATAENGREIATDSVSYQVERAPSTPSDQQRFIESALDLGSPCIPAGGEAACDPMRSALWNGDPSAWATRGVTDPDARFNETVALRVGAGDPAALAAVADALGWPYLKITMLRFAQDELVEITNLGGGAQDLTGWMVRSPANGVEIPLPAGRALQPGEHCFVHTGPTRANPGDRCYVITPEHSELPDGIWPDAGGEIVLFAGPIGMVADDTRYSADIDNQPPLPNLQGSTAAADASAGR